MIRNADLICLFLFTIGISCKKKNNDNPPAAETFSVVSIAVDENTDVRQHNVNLSPSIKISFTAPVNHATVATGITLTQDAGVAVALNASYQNNDSIVVLQPSTPLTAITKYILEVKGSLQSQSNTSLSSGASVTLNTTIDSSRKFPLIADNALLDLVQQQTFKYFWDFAHPVSGLARERNTSGETVTTGGSGFGIMAIVAAIHRGFITRAQGLARMQTIVGFLKNTAQKFHGAFPHWLNGSTGVVIPFSMKDDGADLVETSFLIEGLLTARQYFNDPGTTETSLRNDINAIWNGVEWSWFRQNNQNVLYWHWSPNYNWQMNVPVRGWNECLITYVLAASPSAYSIPAAVYASGWAGAPGFINGSTYYGYTLPLGPALGGPLFFEHYSFLSLNPNGLRDMYADYAMQTKNHALINYSYCKANPRAYFGYSDSVWGLTASDIKGGYSASSPTNDSGVIAPTAALSSFPYTPNESMAALKFYYYVLGDKIWKQYGFVDAFSLHDLWFADSFLSIDQGPIIVMIENYRSGLLWNLFTSCPEVKAGLISLGFTAPYL